MADLLECLIQVKGLHETANRLGRILLEAPEDGAGATRWAELLARLASREQTFAGWLRSALPDGPSLSRGGAQVASHVAAGVSDQTSDEPSSTWHTRVAAFLSLRTANLAVFDHCSAADLSSRAAFPGRGSTAVADAVAIMLADDTETIGVMRDLLPTGPCTTPRRHGLL